MDPACMRVCQALKGVGVEWLMKATALIRHEGVHIPIYGYQWRQRQDSLSKSGPRIYKYNEALSRIQSYLLCQVYPEGLIPLATVE